MGRLNGLETRIFGELISEENPERYLEKQALLKKI